MRQTAFQTRMTLKHGFKLCPFEAAQLDIGDAFYVVVARASLNVAKTVCCSEQADNLLTAIGEHPRQLHHAGNDNGKQLARLFLVEYTIAWTKMTMDHDVC